MGRGRRLLVDISFEYIVRLMLYIQQLDTRYSILFTKLLDDCGGVKVMFTSRTLVGLVGKTKLDV